MNSEKPRHDWTVDELRAIHDLPLPELLAACRADLEAFLDGGPLGDDLSLLAVRRRESEALSRPADASSPPA